jgi:hypothetical protein
MIQSKSVYNFVSYKRLLGAAEFYAMHRKGIHPFGLLQEQGAAHKLRHFSSSTNTSPKDKPTILDLIKGFPSGFLALFDSYRVYQNVIDASKTPVNAWSKLGHVPRRQAEQVRSFKRDFKKVLLPVSFAAIPIIGNLIFIPIAMNPGPFLSNHFLRGYETSLAKNEYVSRLSSYESCLNELKSFLGSDKFADSDNDPLVAVFQTYDHLSWSKMSRAHIQSLAHATGISHIIAKTFPSFYLIRQLKNLGKDILADNVDLLQETHHLDSCQRLTDEEVLEACHFRGLPIDDNMRSSLCQYLHTAEQIMLHGKNDKSGHMKGIESEADIIITLHLSVLVYKKL